MIETLPTTLLSSLSDFLVAQMGLYFPPNRTPDLERGVLAASREFGFPDPQACVEWLLSSSLTQHQIETLASQLTVGETYFFRERQAFEALEQQVLPALLRSRAADRRLRIWSAGCATGEEPYSLAILLARLIPDRAAWKISILGTDINPQSLQKASAGIYTAWSFRDCPAGITELYFNRLDEGHWQIKPEIRKMVAFSYLNLVEDFYPSLLNETNALDLVFCRNVLMYFGSDQSKRVIHRLHRCLLEGSWLLVSSTEASHILYSAFTTVNFPGAIFYRKDGHPPGDNCGERANKGTKGTNPNTPDAEAALWTGQNVIYRDLPDISVAWVPDLPTEDLAPWQGHSVDFTQDSVEPAPTFVEPGGQIPGHNDPFPLYEEGHYSQAAEAASAILSENPSDVRALALLARAFANQGNLSQALNCCDQVLAAEKLNSAFHYLRAIILQEQGSMEEAANSLKRAIYLDQHFVLAHFALGNLHRLRQKPREAEKHFQNALSLLKEYGQEEILPESEGITAGRLREIIGSLVICD